MAEDGAAGPGDEPADDGEDREESPAPAPDDEPGEDDAGGRDDHSTETDERDDAAVDEGGDEAADESGSDDTAEPTDDVPDSDDTHEPGPDGERDEDQDGSPGEPDRSASFVRDDERVLNREAVDEAMVYDHDDDAGDGSEDGTDDWPGQPDPTQADDPTASTPGAEAAGEGEVGPAVDEDRRETDVRETEVAGPAQPVDDGMLGEGPQSDEEMPLADHIEEMMRRLGVVFLVGGLVTVTVLGIGEAVEQVPTAVDIINYLWNHNIPNAPENPARRPRVYGPLELVLTELKVTALAGVLVALPVFVYETYLFMRPGLYPNERRYYLAAVPTSLVLAVIGMAFAHFVVVPSLFGYLTAYTTEGGAATVAFGLKETFNLILVLMGYMAIVFQIPLFVMLAIMMNLVTRVWLEQKRLLFWGAFLTLAFVVSPDPTGMAPIMIAVTMVALFEGTLALLRWTGN